MSSAVMCGLPIFAPLALAFAIPDLTLSRMIRNSNSANTPLIWIKAFVIGSICPLEQSTQMLPTMDRRRQKAQLLSARGSAESIENNIQIYEKETSVWDK